MSEISTRTMFTAISAASSESPVATLQRAWRRLELTGSPVQFIRKLLLRLRGARIGSGTQMPRIQITWPHQIQLGSDCTLQPDVFFNYSHHWMPGPSMIFGDRVFIGRGCEFNIRGKIIVGDDCLIASNCTFVDSNHGLDVAKPMNAQPLAVAPIILGRNVWLGARCVVLKGVHIGDGAVIGAGSVVTRSIPPGETWAGVPARPVRSSSTNHS